MNKKKTISERTVRAQHKATHEVLTINALLFIFADSLISKVKIKCTKFSMDKNAKSCTLKISSPVSTLSVMSLRKVNSCSDYLASIRPRTSHRKMRTCLLKS